MLRTAAANVTAVQAKFDKARADEKAVATEIAVAQANYELVATMLEYAAITRGNKSLVYVVKDSRVHPREVASGYQDGTIVAISSGLEPGEIIVASGAGQFREGQEVVARIPPRSSGG